MAQTLSPPSSPDWWPIVRDALAIMGGLGVSGELIRRWLDREQVRLRVTECRVSLRPTVRREFTDHLATIDDLRPNYSLDFVEVRAEMWVSYRVHRRGGSHVVEIDSHSAKLRASGVTQEWLHVYSDSIFSRLEKHEQIRLGERGQSEGGHIGIDLQWEIPVALAELYKEFSELRRRVLWQPRLVPPGEDPPQPSELMMLDKLREKIVKLEEQFEQSLTYGLKLGYVGCSRSDGKHFWSKIWLKRRAFDWLGWGGQRPIVT